MIPCTIIFNSPLDGYLFRPIKCRSKEAAKKLAKEWGFPYNLYDANGNVIRHGWYFQN